FAGSIHFPGSGFSSTIVDKHRTTQGTNQCAPAAGRGAEEAPLCTETECRRVRAELAAWPHFGLERKRPRLQPAVSNPVRASGTLALQSSASRMLKSRL